MSFFIDRRLNPKDKSLGNRQRFLKRARAQIKEVVNKSIKDRSVTDVASGEKIKIPTKGIQEPRFRNSRNGGKRSGVQRYLKRQALLINSAPPACLLDEDLRAAE